MRRGNETFSLLSIGGSMKSQLFRFPSAQTRDPEVEAWLNARTDGLGALARRWFDALRACGPDVQELLHDGHPTACAVDAAFAYVDAFKSHVSVGFYRGASLPDPANLLEGKGKSMRHVKLRLDDSIDSTALLTLIQAAYVELSARRQEEDAAGL